MLSDEEKYAIDYLKIYIERDVMYENRHYKQIEIILNLIEKQSKEIEELKQNNKKLDRENQSLFEAYNFNDTNLLSKILKEYRKEIEELKNIETYKIAIIDKDKYISKDKIRAILNGTIRYATDTASPDLIAVERELEQLLKEE